MELAGDVFEEGALAIVGEGRQEVWEKHGYPALGTAQEVLEVSMKRLTGENDQLLR